MAERADNRAIDSMGGLRAKFVSSSESVIRFLDDCFSQVQRVDSWLSNEAQIYWKTEARRRDQKLSTALADLQRAQLSRPDVDPRTFFDQQRAVRKAKLAREEATVKLQRIKYWQQELSRCLLKLRGRLQPMRTWAETDALKCVAYIRAMEEHLSGYLSETPASPEPSMGMQSESEDCTEADGPSGGTP